MSDEEKKTMEPDEKAFEIALDVRKFEIDLYWRRTNYFWVLITAVFSGYFIATRTAPGDSELAVLFSSIGLVLSLAWYLANRGSKYWQENWEGQVAKYDNKFAESIFAEKNLRKSSEDTWWHLHKGYRYSVSKVNQIVSLYITVIWVALLVSSLSSWLKDICNPTPSDKTVFFGITIILLTLLTVASLVFSAKGKWREKK